MSGDDDFTEDDHEPHLDEESQPADDIAEVICPSCGEVCEIALDAGGGGIQDYVEDCQVCCRPMRVHVSYGRDGHAQVGVQADDEGDGDDDN